jgi:hypothetical protein
MRPRGVCVFTLREKSAFFEYRVSSVARKRTQDRFRYPQPYFHDCRKHIMYF